MIAIDASAICAIVFDEPERDRFLGVLEAADGAVISPVNFWEACVSVQNRRAVDGEVLVSDALFDAGVVVAQIGRVETELAFDAWRRFGKGRHAAALNLGDCFAYALAKSRDLPLLFKGDDFAQTDVRSAA